MSKDAILSRIRAAHGRRAAPDRDAAYAAIERGYRSLGELDPSARLELFEERLRDYNVRTLRCAPGSEAEAIAQLLHARGNPNMLLPTGFPEQLLPPGFSFTSAEGLTYPELDRAGGVITLCAAAIALTGTIILDDSAPGQGRRALSLIPDYHLCIVDAAQLVETVPEGIRAMDSAGVRVLTTVSGPSATSDIEMTRIRGVHGPRTLEVIIRTA